MKKVLVFIFALSLFIGCGGGGGGESAEVAYPVDISLLDGYIIDANISDTQNTPVQYRSSEKVYHFYDTPQGTIRANGGTFTTGLANKMSFSVPANTKVITPVVAFLNDYSNLKDTLANALDVSADDLSKDYIKENKIQIAKFAQIVYAMSIHNLTSKFASEIEDAKTYEAIAYGAVKASSGNSKENEIKNFIYALDDLNSVVSVENDIYSQKKIMQQSATTSETEDNNESGEVASVMSVDEVNPVGNLKLNVVFSENIVVNTEAQKSAFSLNEITSSNIKLDDNSTMQVSARSITLPLQSAISVDESANTYTIKATNKLLSSEGLSLGVDEVTISPTEENLVLKKVTFVNSKKIEATFNLPINTSTINKSEFSVNSKSISYKPTSVAIDSSDDTVLIVTLGNTLTTNLGYDLVINSDNLSATNGTSKLLNSKATIEFTAKVVQEDNLSEGFNMLSASVDNEQQNITVYFSKSVMSNPQKSMFSVTLDTLQESMDLNISDNNGTSKTVSITPPNVLLSPEQNASYKLSVAKQSFYSVDGSRTLGSTYSKTFKIENYPTVTATLSGKVININFNMSMDLNSSFIKVSENGTDSNATLGGSGANYTLTHSEDFNQSATTLTINSGVLSSDGNYKLEANFIKDFNSTN